MTDQVSPLAPDSFPVLPAIAGVRTATVLSGIKYTNRDDVLVAALAQGTTVAGSLTLHHAWRTGKMVPGNPCQGEWARPCR